MGGRLIKTLQAIIKTEHGYSLVEGPEARKKRAEPYDTLIEDGQVRRAYLDGT
jgi:hypothetical protein